VIAETVIIHGGDFIEWREAGAFMDRAPSRIPPGRLLIRFTKGPEALHVVQKPYGTLLRKRSSAAAAQIVAGEATAEDTLPPPQTAYPIEGVVSDPSGTYLPRSFSLMLGNSGEHVIQLYRSAVGAPFTRSGGVFGQVGFDDGATAPWALLYLTVTPSLAAPLRFVAQADKNGEFRLPLDHLPALLKDSPTTVYQAKLAVRSARAPIPEHQVDPDTLLPVKVAKGISGSGKSLFADMLNLTVTPGTATQIVSPKHSRIVIQSK
jgi:hypothetical protein